MNNYLDKYLKYKNKYLKKNGGSSSSSSGIIKPDLPSQIIIITTGLGDPIKFNDTTRKYTDIYYNIWITLIFPQVKRLIQKYFPTIEFIKVYNYDKFDSQFALLQYQDNDTSPMILDNTISNYNFTIGEYLKIKEMPENINSPIIIFDFAHIFNYCKTIGLIEIAGHYQELDKGTQIYSNCLYLGYLGEIQKEHNSAFLTENLNNTNIINYLDFFIIRNGIVITYIDRLIEQNYDFQYDPQSFIHNILNKIRSEYFKAIRELKSSLNPNNIELIFSKKDIKTLFRICKLIYIELNIEFSESIFEEKLYSEYNSDKDFKMDLLLILYKLICNNFWTKSIEEIKDSIFNVLLSIATE